MMENVDLEFKNEGLQEIAKMAIKRKTGARGLRSIFEDLLLDLMFDIPDSNDLKKIIISKTSGRGVRSTTKAPIVH